MVEIKGLNKFYGKFIALNNLDLHIDKGELFGFVGPNGAGKTTTMKILSGLLKAIMSCKKFGAQSAVAYFG